MRLVFQNLHISAPQRVLPFSKTEDRQENLVAPNSPFFVVVSPQRVLHHFSTRRLDEMVGRPI